MTSHAKPLLSPVSFHFIFVLRFLNFTDAVIHLPVHPASQTHKFQKDAKFSPHASLWMQKLIISL